MSSPDSTEAIEAAFLAYRCNRDPAALATVYDGTVSRLLAIATHISGDTALAEDAVQETFLFALENPERWNPSRPLVPWLLSILGFRLKKARARERREPDPERVPVMMSATSEPGAEFAASEEFARIERAITHLPQPYQTVVLLRLRSGLRPVDIAVALNRKPSTVRAQLTRGLEMLRRVLPVATVAMLSGSLSAAFRNPSAREAVLARATELHRAVLLARRVTWLRCWAVGMTACFVAVLAWSGWHSDDASRAQLAQLDGSAEVRAAQAAVPDQVPRVDAGNRSSPSREAVALGGTLRVTVECLDRELPFAAVELEPLADPPRYLVHHHTRSGQRWSEVASNPPAPVEQLRRGTTGDRGSVEFSHLPPGGWICRALDAAAVLRIDAGELTEIRLQVDSRSVSVRGLVLDHRGQPVRGAEVWSVDETRRTHARSLARTDAGGRFSAAVSPFTTIGVAHSGGAVVATTLTPDNTASVAEVVLRLAGAGAMLEGRVVDDRGQPVGGAVVEVGHPNDWRVAEVATLPREIARRMRTVSDARGRFTFEALVPGETIVLAHRGGLGARLHVIDLERSQRSTVEIELPAVATLEGIVRDAADRPVAGAHVSVGRRGRIGHCAGVTDKGGRYRLSGITPGRLTVEVNDYRGAFAFRTVDCSAGETSIWNPVLSRGNLRLAGQVVDARGKPFAGGWIVHRGQWRTRVRKLDESGRFEVVLSERVAALSSGIHVYSDEPRTENGRITGTPVVARAGLRAGAPDLVITVPDVRAADCRVSGRVIGSPGVVPADLMLTGKTDSEARRGRAIRIESDGTFSVDGVLPGTYVLRLGATRRAFGPFTLRAGSHLDVGTLRLPPSDIDQRFVKVHFALVFPHHVAATEAVQLEVRDEHGWLRSFKIQGASLAGKDVFVELPPGRFVLRATSESELIAERQIVVDPRQPILRALPIVFGPQ